MSLIFEGEVGGKGIFFGAGEQEVGDFFRE
jgi:hypothetical protein